MNEYNLNCIEGGEIEEEKKTKSQFQQCITLRDGLVGNKLACHELLRT